MTLYAISFWEDYSGGGILRVFSTRELAEKCLNAYPNTPTRTYEIEEIKVDDWKPE